MALDQDLQALVQDADVGLVLQAHHVQAMRDNAKALAANTDAIKNTAFPTSDADRKASLLNNLIYNYMKPSTATTPEGIQTDVTRDAAWVKAAAEAVWAQCNGFIKTP